MGERFVHYHGAMTSIAPYLWAALAAFLIAVPGLLMLFSAGNGRAHPWSPRRLHLMRRFFGLVLVLLALAIALLAFSIQRYLQLFEDRPVAALELVREAPQQFRARLTLVGEGGTVDRVREFTLQGDAWLLDARVLRWQLPAALAGVPSLYRLERLSGRYDDIEQERQRERSVYDVQDDVPLDLFSLKQQFSRWLPFVDARYGSATWMPMIDGARYLILFNDRGGLLARPADAHTADLLRGTGFGLP